MTDRTAACYLFVFLLCIYLLTAGGHYGGDGFWNYLTARSLVIDGDLKISDQTFAIPEMQRQYEAVASSGRIHSKYGLGLPLLEVPFFAVGHFLSGIIPKIPADYLTMFTVSMTNVVLCALWGVLFFFTVCLLGYSRPCVFILTFIFALGTMAFPYSGYGFSEPLVGAGILLSVYGAIAHRKRAAVFDLAIVGIGLGLAVSTKLYALIVLPVLVYYLRSEIKNTRKMAALFLPLFLFFVLIACHNWARYGNVFLTGYHLDILSQQGGYFAFWPSQIVTALYGLFLSTGRGLLFFLPVVCVFPWAYRACKTSHPDEAFLFLSLIAVHIVLVAGMIDWHGGSCWGPRYLLPVVPFFILPSGELIARSQTWMRCVVALGFAGLVAQLPGVLANPHLFVRFAQDKEMGDLLFVPGQTGDLVFSPYLSPILGGYYQIVSGLVRLFTGQSLTYTISSSTTRSITASLESYDVIDVWWLNAMHTGMLGTGMIFTLLLFVLILILTAVYTAYQFFQWQRQS